MKGKSDFSEDKRQGDERKYPINKRWKPRVERFLFYPFHDEKNVVFSMWNGINSFSNYSQDAYVE